MIGLGIDAGGSSTRWMLLDGHETIVAQGKADAVTGHVFTERDRLENLSRLEGVLRSVLAVARPDAVATGITGLDRHSDAAALYTTCIAETLGLDPARVEVGNDMHIAYASTFEPGEGVLVYAGTGSIGYHERADGTILRSGGYGYLIDDAGGGYWVGRKGLKQVLRWHDELGHPSDRPLASAIYQSLGSRDWNDIRTIVYGSGRSRVASLAPAVAQAATQGDGAANLILAEAGQELARLANTLLNRIGQPLPIAFCGGIVNLHPVLADALQGLLPQSSSLRLITEEPVRTAARLAIAMTHPAP
jgi:glucosamine kinase